LIRGTTPWDESALAFGICNLTTYNAKRLHKLLNIKRLGWNIADYYSKISDKNEKSLMYNIMYDWTMNKSLMRCIIYVIMEY
jgi:hypothetical protein